MDCSAKTRKADPVLFPSEEVCLAYWGLEYGSSPTSQVSPSPLPKQSSASAPHAGLARLASDARSDGMTSRIGKRSHHKVGIALCGLSIAPSRNRSTVIQPRVRMLRRAHPPGF